MGTKTNDAIRAIEMNNITIRGQLAINKEINVKLNSMKSVPH
jgi:hypothetical protein